MDLERVVKNPDPYEPFLLSQAMRMATPFSIPAKLARVQTERS